MNIREYFVKRAEDEHDGPCALSVMRYEPDEPPRFIVQIIHGISERKERYAELLGHIAAHGGMAVIHDLRGHGSTVRSHDELGYFGDFGYDYSILFDDIDAVFASLAVRPTDGELVEIKETADLPTLPRCLLGFSMGALITALYTAKRAHNISGVILSGLPHREPLVSAGLCGLKLLSLVCGEESKPKLLNKYAFGRYNRHFEREPDSDGQFLWLSNDIGNRRAFSSDPVCNHQKSLNAYINLLHLVRDTYRPMSWDIPRRPLPILICAGELDPVAGGDHHVLKSAQFFSDIGFTDVTVTMYRGMRHEIFFDIGRETPFADITSFCEKNLGADPTENKTE